MADLKAAFHTLGCKTNHYETDAIRAQFAKAGFREVPFHESADVYLVNTCAVTGEADRKSCQMLRRARRANPGAIVAAVGCHVELSGAAGLADIQVGTYGKSRILEFVRAEMEKRGKPAGLLQSKTEHESAALVTDRSRYEELGLVDTQSETRAVIKIEDGCDNACAYCAIPLARGPVRSRPDEMILIEAAALAAAGYREIVMTGIHLCSYGKDLGRPGHAVMELALALADIGGISRIRLGSLDPECVTPAFISLARQNRKLLPHFHLSLQSGSDTVLARMNRQYRTAQFRDTAGMLRSAFMTADGRTNASPGLTTDIMTGFPGETDGEHQASLDFCREIGFSRMHVFRYSSRPGTTAANMPGKVDAGLSGKRAGEMLELAGQLALDFHQAQVGRRLQVLLEEKQPDGCFAGYTPEYVPVRLPSAPGIAPGMIVEAIAVSANREFLVCHDAKNVKSCYDGLVKRS